MENYIKHVDLAVERAERQESKINLEVRSVPAYTSDKIRHLLNNIGSMDGLNHLEIGVHRGGTYVATNYGNNLNSVAVDNWSEFAQDGTKAEFLGYCDTLLAGKKVRFIERDCFKLTKEDFAEPINFYNYDGNHSYESQVLALTHMYPILADTFILTVDDYSWADVNRGTRKGIADLNLKVLYERELYEGYWNGMFVAVLQK